MPLLSKPSTFPSTLLSPLPLTSQSCQTRHMAAAWPPPPGGWPPAPPEPGSACVRPGWGCVTGRNTPGSSVAVVRRICGKGPRPAPSPVVSTSYQLVWVLTWTRLLISSHPHICRSCHNRLRPPAVQAGRLLDLGSGCSGTLHSHPASSRRRRSGGA